MDKNVIDTIYKIINFAGNHVKIYRKHVDFLDNQKLLKIDFFDKVVTSIGLVIKNNSLDFMPKVMGLYEDETEEGINKILGFQHIEQVKATDEKIFEINMIYHMKKTT